MATSTPRKNTSKDALKKSVKADEKVAPIKKVAPRKSSVRPQPVSIVEKISEEITPITIDKTNLDERKFVIIIAVAVAITAFITFGVTHKLDSNSNVSTSTGATSFIAKISGGVALTEPQLRDVIKQLKRTVYWTGPVNGARYTINALTDGQTYLRYLPDGKGVSDTQPKYRTVGTYESQEAYTATLAAGNQANGVSYTTTDGRVIHYNKNSEGNVYLAFKGKPYQIEIFDPKSGIALEIANQNKLEVIK